MHYESWNKSNWDHSFIDFDVRDADGYCHQFTLFESSIWHWTWRVFKKFIGKLLLPPIPILDRSSCYSYLAYCDFSSDLLSLDKKAIEGFVRSKLRGVGFVSSPDVKVRATKNKIKVKVKGQLTRTSSLIGKTNALMTEIQNDLQEILGSQEKIKVNVAYKTFDEEEKNTANQSRVQ